MESVYGVQLLDDLHAYFPDILYEPERFETVQDLLAYVQEQAQEHFNLYSRGRRLHAASRASPAAAASSAASVAPAAATSAAATYAASASAAPAPSPATTASSSSSSSPTSTAAAATSAAATAAPLLPPRQTQMRQTPLYTSFYQEFTPVVPPSNPFRFRPLATGAGAGAGAGTGASLLFDFGMDRDDGSSQLLSSLLNLALIGGGSANLATNFMDPVVVRPTADQINAATSVVVLTEALEANCAICQDRMEAQNPTRKINVCGHSFHKECIDTWFERSVSCPVCRHDVRQLEAVETPAREDEENVADID